MDSPPSECFWIISDLETNHGSQHFAFSPIFVTSNQPFFRGIFHDSQKKNQDGLEFVLTTSTYLNENGDMRYTMGGLGYLEISGWIW